MAAEPESLQIASARGPVSAIYHPSLDGRTAVVCVGGTDGGLDGPADGLYPALASDLAPKGIGVLRLDFRDRLAPGIVTHGVADLEAGVLELRRRGVNQIALVGHSFGGAVVITAAAADQSIRTVITLSTQTAGAAGVWRIAPRPILLIHGLDDIRLPPICSREVFRLAGEPKELVLLEGARHSLRQRADDVRRSVEDWLVAKLLA